MQRSIDTILDDLKTLLGEYEAPYVGYTHVKVNEEPGFHIQDYVEEKFVQDVPSKPCLVVRHRYGKSEQAHFHVQGFLQDGLERVGVHSTRRTKVTLLNGARARARSRLR